MGTAVCRVEAQYFVQWQLTYPWPERTAASVAACHFNHGGNILFLLNWDLEYTFVRTRWVPNVYILSLFLCKNYNKNVLEWPFCLFNIRDRNRNILSYFSWWTELLNIFYALLIMFSFSVQDDCVHFSTQQHLYKPLFQQNFVLTSKCRHFVETISITSK